MLLPLLAEKRSGNLEAEAPAGASEISMTALLCGVNQRGMEGGLQVGPLEQHSIPGAALLVHCIHAWELPVGF